MSKMALLERLAAAIMSSCLLLIPADTDLAVAFVIALVQRIKSSGVTFLHPSLVFKIYRKISVRNALS